MRLVLKLVSLVFVMLLLSNGAVFATVNCANLLKPGQAEKASAEQNQSTQNPVLKQRELLNLVPKGAAATDTLDNVGEIDGDYACSVKIGSGPSVAYTVAIDGHADGEEEMVVELDSTTQQFYGSAFGVMNGDTFAGTNSFGLPFSFAVDFTDLGNTGYDTQVTLTGTYGITVNSVNQTATLSCTSM